MGYRAKYTPFRGSPQEKLNETYWPITTPGGPVGLPSGGGAGEGTVIGPVGVSTMALRVEGKETVVVSSSATINQWELFFTFRFPFDSVNTL
jgi:hypothetical protein